MCCFNMQDDTSAASKMTFPKNQGTHKFNCTITFLIFGQREDLQMISGCFDRRNVAGRGRHGPCMAETAAIFTACCFGQGYWDLPPSAPYNTVQWSGDKPLLPFKGCVHTSVSFACDPDTLSVLVDWTYLSIDMWLKGSELFLRSTEPRCLNFDNSRLVLFWDSKVVSFIKLT